MLYIDVTKVDRNVVAHVVMTIHICFNVYVPNVSSVPYGYCKCFVWMLQK
jgi:hypothetical protein